jgi:hypothetical protein
MNMGRGPGKTEGGHARGHSNMAYWGTHQEAKTDSRKRRRIDDGREERKAQNKPGGHDESSDPAEG